MSGTGVWTCDIRKTDLRVCHQRQLADEQLVHDYAQRIKVGTSVKFVAALAHCLLGRHVRGSPEHHPGDR
jgi:hypothetical protein